MDPNLFPAGFKSIFLLLKARKIHSWGKKAWIDTSPKSIWAKVNIKWFVIRTLFADVPSYSSLHHLLHKAPLTCPKYPGSTDAWTQLSRRMLFILLLSTRTRHKVFFVATIKIFLDTLPYSVKTPSPPVTLENGSTGFQAIFPCCF